jgi:hypothetical protein
MTKKNKKQAEQKDGLFAKVKGTKKDDPKKMT